MNAQELVDRVVRDARIPQGHTYRTPSTLLGMADEAMETLVVPELLKVAGRYLAAHVDLPLVAGKSKYRLPARALRGEHVQRLDAGGKVVEPFEQAQLPNLARLEGTSGSPQFWYFDASSVVVRPTPAESSGFLRITYARRPGALILPTAAAAVTAVAEDGDGVEFTFSPAGALGATGAAVTLDVIRGTPGFESILDDAPCTVDASANTKVTVDGVSIDDVAIGDWLCVAGRSPVPQVPLAYHVVLAQAVVVRVLKDLGRADAHARAVAALYGAPPEPGLLATARDTVAPRNRDPRVIVQMDW
jgi:hypothetical protein